MSNLQENTQYNSKGKQSPLVNLSSITKLLQENSQKTAANTFKSSLMSNYTPETFTKIFGSTNVPISNSPGGAPINEQAFPTAAGVKTQPLPVGYNQFAPADEKGNWVNPSDQAKAFNWPSDLGGGQFITDPTQPGSMVKSERAIMDNRLNPGAKQKLLGNLSPALYQVDHIIPLWAGGADTLNNLQVLDNPTHKKKTAIQAVALTLLSNKKMNLSEARNLAFNWKDKDASSLPSMEEIDKLGGYIPLSTAEKIAKKWQEDISKPNTMKYFGESFKEKMGTFGDGWLPDPLREAAKGFIGGVSANIIPGTSASEDSSTLSKFANVGGNILGTIFGLGKFAKGLSLTKKGAASLFGSKKAIGLADEAAQAAGLVTDVGNLTAQTVMSTKRAETLKKMVESAGLLSLWGQLGVTGREATGQMDAEMKNHMKQFFTDVAFGGLLGSAGQSVKGYSAVGLGSTAFSLMEGSSMEDALKDGALMTSLHAMGYKRGMIDPKLRIGNEEAYKMSATTMNKYLGDIIPTVKKGQGVPEVLKLDIPKVDKMRIEYQQKYPNDQRFKNLGPITNDVEAIAFMEQASKRQLGNLIAKSEGTIPQEDIKKEMTRIITAKNQLYNQTLSPELRTMKEWDDLVSIGEKLRPGIKTEQVRVAANANDNLRKIPTSIPNQNFENPQGLTFPTGKGGVTGYGEKIDVNAKANIDDFAKNPQNYDGKIYIPKTDAETAAIQRSVNFDYLSNNKPAPVEVPEHTLRAFIRTVDGEFKPVGYIPQAGSFNSKKYDLNMTHREQVGRFKHTIETAKTPEQMQSMFAKDKAGIDIDEKTARLLFEKKGSFSDDELYALLKPREVYHYLDPKLNNSELYKKMDELGIDNLVIDPLKAWEMGGTRPRYTPNNPYLNIDINEQDWLRSLALKGADVKPVSRSQAASSGTPTTMRGSVSTEMNSEPTQMTNIISKFTNKQKTDNVVDAIEKTAPKLKDMSQPSITATVTPKAEVVIPKITQAPKITEPAKILESQIQPKEIPIGSTRNSDLVDQYFSRIVHDIEYRKVKPDSPEGLEKIYMNIVDSFKVKNPGIPEKEFKNIIEDAKSRARFYVQDSVDDMYKGTKVFGTEDLYSRKKTEVPDVDKIGRDEKLAKEFGLKLKEPNDAGIKYLELDKRGNPIFSEEYIKAHPSTKGSPLDVWGSFLGNELKANKAELSLQSKTWAEEIKRMKNSKNPYSRGVAETLEKAMSAKYDVKDPKTGETKFGWEGSWKLNSALKKIKNLFSTKNEEGQLLSQPFRSAMAAGSKKNYEAKRKDVAKTFEKTKEITEKAQDARINNMSSEKAANLPSGMRVKDINQIMDVVEDLTPYDMLHSGLIKKEMRDNLIQRYNGLREEMKPSRRIETRVSPSGEKILGTEDEMKRLFTGIKKLSEYLPESKNWKLGDKINLKNKGEPTFEEGIQDGIKIAAELFKLNKTKGFVGFENIKNEVLKNKNTQGGFSTLKSLLAATGITGAGALGKMSSSTTYNAPERDIEDSTNTKTKEAIGMNETGVVPEEKRYSFFKDSGNKNLGRDMGKYQITEGELKTYAKIYLGREITSEEFLSSPQIQEEYMDGKIEYLRKKGYTPQEIADIHRRGMKNSSAPGAGKYQDPDYVNKFNLIFNN